MNHHESHIASTTKTVAVAAGGTTVWAMDVNDLVAIATLIFVVSSILEKWGVLTKIKSGLCFLCVRSCAGLRALFNFKRGE